jgi:hypothetical protein
MADLLAGPYFGREWKNVLDAQCQTGGFDEFLSAMNWLVLQLGGGEQARTPKTGGRISRWLTSCLALAGPDFGLV